MKVLDRYIFRELAVPVIFCSISLVVLILIADVFDNLDEFLRYGTSGKVILNYYLALVPFSFVQTIPWAAWLGTLFLLINFGFHNETLAMKVAGLKISSIIRPVLFLGFLLGILTFTVSDRLVPHSHRKVQELSEIHIQRKTPESEGKAITNVTFHSANNQIYYFRILSLTKKEAKNAIILWLDPLNHKTHQKVTAQRAIWKDGAWELEGVTEHQVDSRGRILGEPKTYPRKLYLELKAPPNDIANASRDSSLLTYKEMKEVMQKLKETGANVHSEMIEIQSRLALPWQSLVMMLITIPVLGPTRPRKGIAAAVLVCVGLVFGYHLTTAIGMALGSSGLFPAFFSAWFGNIVFAVAALVTLDRANF